MMLKLIFLNIYQEYISVVYVKTFLKNRVVKTKFVD